MIIYQYTGNSGYNFGWSGGYSSPEDLSARNKNVAIGIYKL